MGLRVEYDGAAVALCGVDQQCRLLGDDAFGKPESRLLAEQCGDSGFQQGDRRAFAIVIEAEGEVGRGGHGGEVGGCGGRAGAGEEFGAGGAECCAFVDA